MPNEPAPNDTELPALIAHIVERFHERHRRDVPRLAMRDGQPWAFRTRNGVSHAAQLGGITGSESPFP